MKTSAAICLYRQRQLDVADPAVFEFLIVHPGGPYWKNKDEGAWSLPKGEFDPDIEQSIDAAKREFEEELGSPVPSNTFVDLGHAKLKSGKVIYAWGCEGDLDPVAIRSNEFEVEWPPRSGRRASFPEVDEARWCTAAVAQRLLNPAQGVFVDRLLTSLSAP